MKKIIFILITLIMVMMLLLFVVTALTTKPVPIDTVQKLKVYADNKLKDSIQYSNFEILKIEKFDEFAIIYFKADGKAQRWFKPIKNFDKLVK